MLASSRTIRVISALSAVWCMGCASFDVLLERVVGGSATAPAECAPLRSAESATDADAHANMIVARAVDHGSGEAGCDCDHCVAERTPPSAPVAEPDPVPQSVPLSISAPLSMVRAPLVPPPLS